MQSKASSPLPSAPTKMLVELYGGLEYQIDLASYALAQLDFSERWCMAHLEHNIYLEVEHSGFEGQGCQKR